MKKIYIGLILALSIGIAQAGTYGGFYGSLTNTENNTAGEFDTGNVAIAFGQNMNSKTGLGYEVFMDNDGLGGSVEAFTTINKYKISLGAINFTDRTTRKPVTDWPIATSSARGKGAFIGVSRNIGENRFLVIKYINYNVDHSFTSVKKTGVDINGDPILTSKTGNGKATRSKLWIGLNFYY